MHVGDRQLQLSSAGCFSSILYTCRPQLRVWGGVKVTVRGVPAGRLHNQRGHSRHQDVLHTGGHRRHYYQNWRSGHQSVGRLVFRRYMLILASSVYHSQRHSVLHSYLCVMLLNYNAQHLHHTPVILRACPLRYSITSDLRMKSPSRLTVLVSRHCRTTAHKHFFLWACHSSVELSNY